MWSGFGDDRAPAKAPRKANVFETMMGHQGMQQQKESSHGVTMFLKKPAAPEMENYQISIITIQEFKGTGWLAIRAVSLHLS